MIPVCIDTRPNPAVTESRLPDRVRTTVRHGPFHVALQEAIAHRGLPLSRLCAHLGDRGIHVGASTLSYWQRGLRQPDTPRSFAAIGALESVLGLPPNSLLVLVGPRARAAPTERHAASFTSLARSWSTTEPLLAELRPRQHRDTDCCNADLTMLSVHDSANLGAAGEHVSGTIRMVVRADRAGPDRYCAVVMPDVDADVPATDVRQLEGCRIGRVRRDPTSGATVIELLFDRRLTPGETHVFGYRISNIGTAPTPGVHRAFLGHCESYLLQLAFHEPAVPARCARYLRDREDTAPYEQEDLVCGLGGVVSAYFPDVAPGIAGIAVEWS